MTKNTRVSTMNSGMMITMSSKERFVERRGNMAEKKIPLRKCTGCGEMKPKKELIRVLKTTETEIVVEKTGKKHGRGAYI